MEKLKEWWEKLSTHEKVALGILVAGVVGYALYKRSKNSASASTSSTPNGGASIGQAVDSYGNPLYPTNLQGVYSTGTGGTFSTGTGTTGTTGNGPTATGGPIFPQIQTVTVGAAGGPPNGLSVDQIAERYNESAVQLYADNPWLGTLGGSYANGANYNPDLPGNVNGKTFIVR